MRITLGRTSSLRGDPLDLVQKADGGSLRDHGYTEVGPLLRHEVGSSTDTGPRIELDAREIHELAAGDPFRANTD